MHRQANGPGLFGDTPADRLANPPGGVGAELVALPVVKLLHRPQQAQVALLNQVRQGQAPPDVFLGDADHQAQVGLGQLDLGPLPLPCTWLNRRRNSGS